MKISLIGKDSKVGNALLHSGIARENQLKDYSMRSGEDIYCSAMEADAIVYLTANTNTNLNIGKYIESFYTNCYLLAKYLKANENHIQEKPFIYMSSSKVYDLFPYSSIHIDESVSVIKWYSDVQDVAFQIIDICNKELDFDDAYMALQNLLSQLLSRIKTTGEIPIYSFCKVIGEIIVESLVKNHYILRPTYLYGYQENRNPIYRLIDDIFNHRNVTIDLRKRDYVTYSTLNSIIMKLLIDEPKKERIINVSSCGIIDGFDLSRYVMGLAGINGAKPLVRFKFEKISDFYIVDNSVLVDELSEINRYHIETFEEGYSQLVYRYYIEKICNESIERELIGGSFAQVFLTRDEKKDSHIYKLCLGNGANNENTKIVHEAEQLLAIRRHLKNTSMSVIIPDTKIISETEGFTCIKQEHVDGMNYDDLFKNEEDYESSLGCLERYCENILDIYASGLSKSLTTNMLIYNKRRVISRLTSVNEKNNDLFNDVREFDSIIINGVIYENPLKIIESLMKYEDWFNSKLGVCISGDPILDNFILKNGKFAFIDARGEDLVWENGLPFFDPYYDLAKIYFYFYGWKQIREEEFVLHTNNYSLKDCTCDFRFLGEFAYKYDEFCDKCMKIFISNKNKIWDSEDEVIFINKILLLAGMHFLSDTFPRIVGKGRHIVDQCFSEFLLGTKLVNEAASGLMRSFTLL